MLAGKLTRLMVRSLYQPRIIGLFSKTNPKVLKEQPIPALDDLNLYPNTVKLLIERGISNLFPIQYKTLSDVLDGHDIIAKDRTGSGKTLAYALPLTEKLRKLRLDTNNEEQLPSTRKPKILVMVPTRELAIQVFGEFELLAHDNKDHYTAAFYGGVSIMEQIRKAKNQGMDIVVATPGRLLDHIERDSIDLSEIETVVLDETDEMLEIGFKDAIMTILRKVNSHKQGQKKTQFLLFSATVPDWVNTSAKEFMHKPKFIDMVNQDEMVIPKDIKHVLVKANNYREIQGHLSSVVDTYAGIDGQTIIFTNTKRDADDIVRGRYLRAATKALHGDIQQQERESIFKSFKDGTLKCLVATNVAARGLDFPAVDLVIQINPPNDVESYIHRAGRTGRAGRKGTNVLIYSQEAEQLVTSLKRATKIKFEVVNSFMLQELKMKSEETFRRYVVSAIDTVDEEQVAQYEPLVNEIVSKHGEKEALRRLVAYVVMNPLERKDLREKSRFSSSSNDDSKDYNRSSRDFGRSPRDNDYASRDNSRSSQGNRYTPFQNSSADGQQKNRYNKSKREDEAEDSEDDVFEVDALNRNQRSSGNESQRYPKRNSEFSPYEKKNFSSEPPKDLKDSIFVGNMMDSRQLQDIKTYFSENNLNAEVSYFRLPANGIPGFMRVTPKSEQDYKNIMKMKNLEIAGGQLYISPKKSS